ncbi:DUF429 domain-containing protein [candidate division KSB1 bacterium]|nr:DUF429 domain-containing protein [candidate division KSB1 bacterium]
MRIIRGADGCKGGWIAITKNIDTGDITWQLCKNARELIYQEPEPRIIAVDIPIGLPEQGPRMCDQAARKLLGTPRASSVFPAPIRPVLAARSYVDACHIRYQIEGKKVSQQAWHIISKIKDMDECLRQQPESQSRVHEVHPEVCFCFMADQHAMRLNKKSHAGREERITLLEPIFGECIAAALAERHQLASGADDVLDAFAALWTAERILSGISQTIPPEPPVDDCGLYMEIVV